MSALVFELNDKGVSRTEMVLKKFYKCCVLTFTYCPNIWDNIDPDHDMIMWCLIFAATLEKANLSADNVSAVSKAALGLYNYVLATIHHCEQNNKAD